MKNKKFLSHCFVVLAFLVNGWSLCVAGMQDTLPKISPTKLSTPKTISLPSTIDKIDVGGGGRFLALYFSSLKKIGIFDSNHQKIVHYIPALDSDPLFAAGATKLIQIDRSSGTVSRWSLASGKKELVKTVANASSINRIVLGSASFGPAIFGGGDRYQRNKFIELNLDSLSSKPVTIKQNPRRLFSKSSNVRISANGKVIAVWESGVSPSGLQSYIKKGEEWKGFYDHTSVGAIVPSGDGKILFTSRRLYNSRCQALGSGSQNRSSRMSNIPAEVGPLYLSLSQPTEWQNNRRNNENKPVDVSLKMPGDDRSLAKINGLGNIFKSSSDGHRERMTLDQRVTFVPKANLILQVNQTKDKLILIPFDPYEALKKSSIDYLFISSNPPKRIKAGSNFYYELKVLSSDKKLRFQLDSAPKGMKISSTGRITWKTSENSPLTNQIILSVQNSKGSTSFQSFTLNVDGGNTRVSQVPESANATQKPVRLSKAQIPNLKNGEAEIQLPGNITDAVVGGSGRFLFLHLRDLKKIAVLDLSKGKIVHYIPAGDSATKIVAGATRAVVFSSNSRVLSRYRLDNFKRDLTTTIPFAGSVQFVGMGSGSEGPILTRWSTGTSALDRCNFEWIDLNTLRPQPILKNRIHASYRDFNEIKASANGKVFSVRGVGVLKYDGKETTRIGGFRERNAGIPSANGKFFLAQGRLKSETLKNIGHPGSNFGIAIPSIVGNYFLSFKPSSSISNRDNQSKTSASLYMFGEDRPLVSIKNLAPASILPRYSNSMSLPSEKRIFFNPQLKVIAVIPQSDDRIHLRSFDVDKALEDSGIDYLIVDSQPPITSKVGTLFSYQLSVKSKRGKVTYKLDSGPEGMKVSKTGKVTWKVPKNLSEPSHNIILSIGDASGQSIFHTFQLSFPTIERKIAEKNAEEQKKLRLAREKELKERRQKQQELWAEQRRLAELKKKEREQLKNSPEKKRLVTFSFRTWKDKSGKHSVEAKFVKMIGKTKVILEYRNGKNKTIDLRSLSTEDIYEAIKSDLQKRQGHSPF